MVELIAYIAIVIFLFLFALWLLLELAIRVAEIAPSLGSMMIELWLAWHTAQQEAERRRWE